MGHTLNTMTLGGMALAVEILVDEIASVARSKEERRELDDGREASLAARARMLIGLASKTYRYQAKRAADEEVRERLRELAGERRRLGYRRLYLALQGGAAHRSKARRAQAGFWDASG